MFIYIFIILRILVPSLSFIYEYKKCYLKKSSEYIIRKNNLFKNLVSTQKKNNLCIFLIKAKFYPGIFFPGILICTILTILSLLY